nr:MAG TPA: hypothetical protein [Bacteriophage sp.]
MGTINTHMESNIAQCNVRPVNNEVIHPINGILNDGNNQYAYTIAIAPFKQIKGCGKWQLLKNQKAILQRLIQEAFVYSGINMEYNNLFHYAFELTKADNWHVHGELIATSKQMYDFAVFIHREVGFPRSGIERVCMYTATEYDIEHWNKYKGKDYDSEGSYYPPYPIKGLIE